GLKHFP
ncbi:hypothetical protein BVZ80_01485B, partial [Haemophilus influenzae]